MKDESGSAKSEIRRGEAEVTRLKAALEALERLEDVEKRYRILVESAPDPIFLVDRAGRFLAANAVAARAVGLTPETIVGKSLDEVFPKAAADARWAAVRRVLKTGEGMASTGREIPTVDGPRLFDTNLAPVKDAEGEVQYVIGIARDVTERRRAEAALRQSEQRYQRLVDQMPLPMMVHCEGKIVYVNAACVRMMGAASAKEILGAVALDSVPPEDRPMVADKARRLEAGEGPGGPLQHRLVRADGRVIDVEAFGIPTTHAGKPAAQVVLTDVTERTKAEAALRESERRYRAVVEDQTELICRYLPGGQITFVNEAYCRYFGKRRDELIGHSFIPLMPPEDQELVAKHLASITRERPVGTCEHRVILPDGEVRWQQWTDRALFDDEGTLVEFQAVGRDITPRRQALEALRRSEENYRLLFDESADGIAVISGGRVVRANPAFCRIFGLRAKEFVGKAITESLDVVHPEDRAALVDRLQKLSRGETVAEAMTYRLLRRDGTVAYVEARSKPVHWEGEAAFQAIVRDVTERRRLEERLLEAQKMEAVGQLAGGIAHDFNNLITGILCHANLLKMAARQGDPAFESAEVIEAAARRAAELTSQLLGFARKGKHQNVVVDLGEVVEDVIRLISRTLSPRVRVTRRLQAARAAVMGDPGQLEQAILNLALNARDAMADGGEMRFEIDAVDVGQQAVAQQPEAKSATGEIRCGEPGRYLMLTVSDTGCGIPENLRLRVFEPFFSMKEEGKGIGMGLAMVYGIVRNHGGWVEVESEVGRGSTFRVYLPPAPETAVKTQRSQGRPVGRGGRVLVVDDEAVVRRAVERMLTALGYEVLTAPNGREAVACYLEFGRDVDLVIIDMRMPEMDGRECFRRLRRINPRVKAILATGYETDGAAQELLDEGMVGFVQKPFQAGVLTQAVAAALAGPAADDSPPTP